MISCCRCKNISLYKNHSTIFFFFLLQIIATTPDLIIVADADKAHPIPTEEVQYGLRVVVVALPSPPQLRSPEALQVVGPRAFNYDIDFVPIGEYVAPSPVPPLPRSWVKRESWWLFGREYLNDSSVELCRNSSKTFCIALPFAILNW